MKEKNSFDLAHQQNDLSSKITVGLERVSEVFRVLLWEKAKIVNLSPIQIQILIFVKNHTEKYNQVSYLAQEFNMTKATISDAVRVLEKKELIEKHTSPIDKRAYHISVSDLGEKVTQQSTDFASELYDTILQLPENEQENLYQSLIKIISNLNRKGILQIQRTCFACQFYEKRKEEHYCHFLKNTLVEKEIRIDCPEFEMATS